ncbi:hypothetical protein EDD21DRAFT_385814 [Dissophora ornata]|nr:hypothetical protein EDD21DRAFT_385814 [Dissophora ornata]
MTRPPRPQLTEPRSHFFFLAFEISDKYTARRRYGWVIERCSTDVDQQLLKDEFDQWKSSKGAAYWTDQRARLSATRTAGTLIEASEPYTEVSLRRISGMVDASQVIPSTTPMGPPTHTEQSEPLRLEQLEQPQPAYTSTTYDGSNTARGVSKPGPTVSAEDNGSLLIDEDERQVLLSQI